jgi:hypothetical protein
MVNAIESHGNACGILISPKSWRTLAGGNDRETLRPEKAPESALSCPIRPISPIRPIPPHLGVSASRSLPTWSALIENHNVVPSLSLGLAAQRPTPGKLSHKIQPLIPKPREARIRTAANSPKIQNSTLKIQHCFPHPQTNPHPKSTVDLGYEGLIRVENGLRSPLLPTGYRPISGPKIKESNQNQTATHQKTYSASPLIPASRSKYLLPFPSTANEEFQVKTRPFFAILF